MDSDASPTPAPHDDPPPVAPVPVPPEDTTVPDIARARLELYWELYGPDWRGQSLPTIWDGGATIWDDGNTTWDAE